MSNIFFIYIVAINFLSAPFILHSDLFGSPYGPLVDVLYFFRCFWCPAKLWLLLHLSSLRYFIKICEKLVINQRKAYTIVVFLRKKARYTSWSISIFCNSCRHNHICSWKKNCILEFHFSLVLALHVIET